MPKSAALTPASRPKLYSGCSMTMPMVAGLIVSVVLTSPVVSDQRVPTEASAETDGRYSDSAWAIASFEPRRLSRAHSSLT